MIVLQSSTLLSPAPPTHIELPMLLLHVTVAQVLLQQHRLWLPLLLTVTVTVNQATVLLRNFLRIQTDTAHTSMHTRTPSQQSSRIELGGFVLSVRMQL